MRLNGKFTDRVEGGAGMTMEEIAAALRITRGGVWMILASAYRKLRRAPHAIALLQAAADEAEERRRRRQRP